MKANDLLGGQLSLGDYVQSWSAFVRSLRGKGRQMFILAILGSLAGGTWGYFHPEKHMAQMLIAVEDDDSNGWQNLLSQFGIDVGGNNPGGIFKGESLVRLFKTRSRVENMLTQEVEFKDGQYSTIANRLLKTSRHGRKSIFQGIQLPNERDTYTPLQDSLMAELYHEVVSEVLTVDKPERKLSLIEVTCIHEDKYLAMAMTKELVDQTSRFYVDVLTKKTRANLDVLQREADSVRMALNRNLNSSAASTDLNVNPNRASLLVNQNRALVELQISVSLYGELIKNLKLAEIGVRKQTPIIQIADEPIFPMPRTGMKIWEWSAVMALGAVFGYIFLLSLFTSGSTKF
jgi:hypothetical protein